jgi:hypothetical protein
MDLLAEMGSWWYSRSVDHLDGEKGILAAVTGFLLCLVLHLGMAQSFGPYCSLCSPTDAGGSGCVEAVDVKPVIGIARAWS